MNRLVFDTFLFVEIRGQNERRSIMKLAEALSERSDCQNRLEEIKKRILNSARVQEGEEPVENPAELLAEADRLYERLLELVNAINRTNSTSAFDGKRTISDVIAERDLAGKKRDMLRAVAESAVTRLDRFSRSEVKFIATVDIAGIRKQSDLYAKTYRELDTRIQEMNWNTELAGR
jgi:hypothetical protein